MAKRQFRNATSEETKQLQSIRKQGVNNPNYNKERSKETKDKISAKLRDYWASLPSKDENNG
ncbi:MAG: NUMOD3 domain-containing DNA-binding protein [Paludibacteraceae bacterium]